MCLCERLIVLRAFAASREIRQGPVSREGAKPRSQNIGLFRPRCTTSITCLLYAALFVQITPLSRAMANFLQFIRWEGPRQGIAHRAAGGCSIFLLAVSHLPPATACYGWPPRRHRSTDRQTGHLCRMQAVQKMRGHARPPGPCPLR
jgi:hypothetical protein